MAIKVRKQIYIEHNQELLIKQLVSATGASEAEFIRQAIDHHAQSFRRPRLDLRAWEEERQFMAELMESGPIAGRRTWRREDLYE